MQLFKNELGLSLIEVLLGAAGIGVVALGLMNLTNQQAKNQANVEAKHSSQELKQIITNLFFDKTACSNTLGGTTIGAQINQLKNPANEPIFIKDQKYGANDLTISSIHTVDKNNAVTANSRLVDLIVTFQKNKKITNQTNIAIAIPLKVTVNSPTGPIVDCSSYDDKFVQKSGDVMSGALITTQLNVTNNIAAAGTIQGQKICTGANCKSMTDFVVSNQACPENQYVYSVDGTIKCRALSFSCPPKQVIRAIGPNGAVTCVDLIPPGCPAQVFSRSGISCTIPARAHGQTGSCSNSLPGDCKWGHYGDRGAGWGWKCQASGQVWFGGGNYAEGQCRQYCKGPPITITKTCDKGTWL